MAKEKYVVIAKYRISADVNPHEIVFLSWAAANHFRQQHPSIGNWYARKETVGKPHYAQCACDLV